MDLLHTSSPRRWRLAVWVVLAVVVGFLAWGGWRWADERAAVREAEAAGFEWRVRDPAEVIAVIRADWRAAFRRSTWDFPRELGLGYGADLARLRPLLLRLRPTHLFAGEYPDRNLDALRGLTSLQWLSLNDSTRLQNVDGLRGLTGLQRLILDGCTGLQNVDGLRGLTGLKELYLGGCTGLQNVDGLHGLTGLRGLDLRGCTGLQNVDALRGLTSLRWLFLNGCTGLQNVDGLRGLSGLQGLDLSGCTGLQNVDALRGLTGLQVLSLRGCRHLAPAALRELAAALPKTSIAFPDGGDTPPP